MTPLTPTQCTTLGLAAECRSCARAIGPKDNPEEYADSVARLLLGIGVHESGGWKYRRQVGFEGSLTGGAFGLWQQQLNFLADCQKILHNLNLVSDVLKWMDAGVNEVVTPVLSGNIEALVMSNDRLAIALARVYLLKRAKGRVPTGIRAQAQYTARWYNRGPEQERYAQRWARDWDEHVRPLYGLVDWLRQSE